MFYGKPLEPFVSLASFIVIWEEVNGVPPHVLPPVAVPHHGLRVAALTHHLHLPVAEPRPQRPRDGRPPQVVRREAAEASAPPGAPGGNSGGGASFAEAGSSGTAPAAFRCPKEGRTTESLKAAAVAALLLLRARAVPPEGYVRRYNPRGVLHACGPEELGDAPTVSTASPFGGRLADEGGGAPRVNPPSTGVPRHGRFQE